MAVILKRTLYRFDCPRCGTGFGAAKNEIDWHPVPHTRCPVCKNMVENRGDLDPFEVQEVDISVTKDGVYDELLR